MNNSKIILDNRNCMILLFLTAILTVMAKFGGQPSFEDPFHTGEFLASATNLYFGGDDAYRAVLIHGLSDILPALFAQSFWGLDQHFLPTLTFYRVIDLTSYFLLITSAIQLSNPANKNRFVILLAIALIGPLLVSYRDLALLFMLNIFLLLQKVNGNLYKVILLQIIFGLSFAFSFFWSYDRGLIGGISFGISVLLCLRKNKLFLIAFVTFVIAMVGLGFINKLFLLDRYINHILILISGSSEWSYGLKVTPIILTVFAVFINFFAIYLGSDTSLLNNADEYRLPNYTLLVILALLMLKVAGINRADLMHIYQSFWVPMLLLASGSNDFFLESRIKKYKYQIITVLLLLLFFVLLTPWFGNSRYVSALLVASLIASFLNATRPSLGQSARYIILLLLAFPFGFIALKPIYFFYNGDYKWLSYIDNPPENKILATSGVLWVSERIKETPTHCILDMSNNGVINSLAKLPTCTEFIYPVYASPKYESRIIEQLQAAGPPIVIYSSTFWSYSIDERPMSSRFPALDRYLRNNYPLEDCKFGYCVRFK